MGAFVPGFWEIRGLHCPASLSSVILMILPPGRLLFLGAHQTCPNSGEPSQAYDVSTSHYHILLIVHTHEGACQALADVSILRPALGVLASVTGHASPLSFSVFLLRPHTFAWAVMPYLACLPHFSSVQMTAVSAFSSRPAFPSSSYSLSHFLLLINTV